jgi:cysteine desulfurase / selenocysteine lyase
MSINTVTPRHRREATPPALDVRRVRDDFPILREKVHGKPLAYLDNAASAQKPRAVLDAVRQYYEHDHANIHRAVHLLSERATEAYEEARRKAQRFLNAGSPQEVIFTRGATEAVNLVAQTFGRQHVGPGDEVVISWMEHHSNIVPWQMLCAEKGATLRVVPVTDAGELRLDELERLLTPRTKLLALVHVSNSLGTINPVKQIVELARGRGVPVLLDGAQAVPHLKVDVQDLDCDFYCFSGHKVYGPTGIGVLYGKLARLEAMPPYQGGGDMIRSVSFDGTTYNDLPYKYEAGTPHIAGAVGLGAALDYVEEVGLDAIAAHEHHLLVRATERLSAIPGVRLIGTAKDKAAVVSFVVENPPISALDVGTRLDLEGIAVRTGHHCCQPLMDRFGLPGTARASFAVYNTLDEVDRLADALEAIVIGTPRRPTPAVSSRPEPHYPPAVAASPNEVADDVAETFDLLDEWTDRYQYLIDLGNKLPPMPEELKTEPNRVRGCQSTVFLDARVKPGTADVVEFLADSDADIVRGLLALLQRLFSGQRAAQIMAFDVQGFFRRLGLDKNLSMGRRNGLGEMVQRVRCFACQLTTTCGGPS